MSQKTWAEFLGEVGRFLTDGVEDPDMGRVGVMPFPKPGVWFSLHIQARVNEDGTFDVSDVQAEMPVPVG